MKKTVLLLILAAVLGAGAWWFFWGGEEEKSGEILLYGNVEIRDALLAFNEQDRLTSVLVEEGDRVETGQLLAQLKTDRLHSMIAEAEGRVQAQEEAVKRLEAGTRPEEIDQAKAELAAAEARVANAQKTVDRLRRTAPSGASSIQTLDEAEAELRVEEAVLNVRRKALDLAIEGPRSEDIAQAKALLAASRAQLELLNVRLGDSELRAPSDGIILSRLLEPGEMAAPNLPVLSMALMDPKWVRTYISEPNLGRIEQGMTLEVYSDSFPDKTYEGWVGFISPVAEFTPKSVESTDLRSKLVYETRIFVKDPENELRLGMPVTAVLPISPSPIKPGDSGVTP
jgi:HlyD family secretion protein